MPLRLRAQGHFSKENFQKENIQKKIFKRKFQKETEVNTCLF
jgi:hypothetical protein